VFSCSQASAALSANVPLDVKTFCDGWKTKALLFLPCLHPHYTWIENLSRDEKKGVKKEGKKAGREYK